jgi:hypothetical protein
MSSNLLLFLARSPKSEGFRDPEGRPPVFLLYYQVVSSVRARLPWSGRGEGANRASLKS